MKKLKLLSNIALSFKNLENFQQDMKKVLEDIGEFIDVSRIHIIFYENNEIVNNIFEWHRQDSILGFKNLEQFKYDKAPSWNRMLADNGYICSHDIQDLPQDIIGVLEPRQIKSLLAYPLIIDKKIRGCICFNECRYKRKWEAEEFEILNTVSGIISNVYERKFVRQHLIENEKRFFLALDETKAGLWDLDMVSNELFLSSMWKKILGYQDDEIENSVEIWQELWHPGDKEKTKQAVNDYLQGKTDHYEMLHRLKHKDGNWRWILTRGGVLRDDQGVPYRWIGTNIDITSEQEQAIELERFFSVNLDLLCIIDMEGRFMKTNKAWESILGYSTEELTGRKFLDFVHPEDVASTLESMEKLRQDEQIVEFVNRYVGRDGKYHHIEWKSNPYEGVIYAAARDVTERIEYEKKILEISNRDALTNVYNRRFVFNRAKEIIEEYKRTSKVFSVSILDIDFFKKINDNHGHQAGDYILKEFTETIDKELRPYDILGRYGGEEFIIILKDTDKDKGFEIIERILNVIRNKTFRFNGEDIRFTFSAGIADCNDVEQKQMVVDYLVAVADERMYQAKESGRNKVIYK